MEASKAKCKPFTHLTSNAWNAESKRKCSFQSWIQIFRLTHIARNVLTRLNVNCSSNYLLDVAEMLAKKGE